MRVFGIAIANAGYADRLIVGSEVLYRDDLPDSILIGDAIPSFANAIRYHRELMDWSQVHNIEVNLFSAYDEPWKLPNDDGWGIFFNDKTMKPGMDTLFTPISNIDSTVKPADSGYRRPAAPIAIGVADSERQGS